MLVYVGTYTSPGRSKGIYVFRMDESTGALERVRDVPDVVNPSWVGFEPAKKYLFCVNELKEGGASSFALNRRTGELRHLSSQPTHGGDPCHLTVDPSGRYLLVANHEEGRLTVFPVEEGGKLGPASDVVQHHGSGPGPTQQGPHAHFVTFDPSGRFVLCNDKGIDKTMIYRLDASTGKLQPNDPPYGELHAGAAPRHLSFHPNGRWLYVNGEADMTITSFEWDGQRGAMKALQTLPTLPRERGKGDSTAQIVCHPSGKAVYVSNRGHDSIALFAIDDQGRMTAMGHETTRGKTPRNFDVAPGGRFLYACNQQTDTIVTFAVDQATGRLNATGQITNCPTPVCLAFDPQGG